MKKTFLFAAALVSCCLSAQSTGDFYIQNYSPHYIEFTLLRSNLGSSNCNPTLEPRSTSNGLMKLSYSTNPGVTSTDALYGTNVNTTFAPNATYPATPLIGSWIVNSNYASPYTATTPVPPTFNLVTTYHGMKFGVQDVSGTNIGGYYFMGQTCGSTTIITDLSAYPSPVVNGSYFTFGGATWAVLF